jgi:hypothetical protein
VARDRKKINYNSPASQINLNILIGFAFGWLSTQVHGKALWFQSLNNTKTTRLMVKINKNAEQKK